MKCQNCHSAGGIVHLSYTDAPDTSLVFRLTFIDTSDLVGVLDAQIANALCNDCSSGTLL
jgi:hypothetical protein